MYLKNTNDISDEPSLIKNITKDKISLKSIDMEDTLMKGISNIKTKDSKNEGTDFSYSTSSNKLLNNNKCDKKLIIEEISGNLFPTKIFEIDKNGLISNSLRNKKDGITYFGSNNPNINDYVLNLSDNISKFSETVFKIYYNNDQFYIGSIKTDLSNELMMFIKIEKQFICDKNLIVSLGNDYFSVEPDLKTGSIKLCISTEDGNKTYMFNKEKKKILIGRGKKCDIILHEKSYSRVQSSLVFNTELNKWELYDGEDNKYSTNGTWIYLNWFICIYDNLKLRIGPSLICIKIVNTDN